MDEKHAVFTARLLLMPTTAAWLALLAQDRAAALRQFDAVPPDWPSADLLMVMDGARETMRRFPEMHGWGVWLILRRADRVFVGDIGFFGPPDENEQVEIGLQIAPAHRRQGYAREAVAALIDWAFARRAQVIVARTEHDNEISPRLFDRLGFEQVGRDEATAHWRLSSPHC
ncbi:MAG TPA: GNAT family N-acetyltransferase [bacterium]|nr:GNAT family N-acetyltransferase [bacterium]